MNKQLMIGGGIALVFVVVIILIFAMKKEGFDLVSGKLVSSGTGTPATPAAYLTADANGNIGVSNNGTFNNLDVEGAITLQGYTGNVGDVLVSNGSSAPPVWSNLGGKMEANGYQFLPGGLLIQWGIITTPWSSANNNVTFPIAFPNNVFNVNTSVSSPQPTGGSGDIVVVMNNITKTGFGVSAWYRGYPVYWMAIGN